VAARLGFQAVGPEPAEAVGALGSEPPRKNGSVVSGNPLELSKAATFGNDVLRQVAAA
jgi:hypothetical protein